MDIVSNVFFFTKGRARASRSAVELVLTRRWRQSGTLLPYLFSARFFFKIQNVI